MVEFKSIIKEYCKSKSVEFIFINYSCFDDLKTLIENKLPLIGGGAIWEYSFEEAKKVYSMYLKEKKRVTVIGSIAELCIHIFLNDIGYQQHCLFFNLEENSIKKGFDGVYVSGDITWYVESKSTEDTDRNHDYKINEALNDLIDKIEGHPSNNPWKNAFNHACLASQENNESLLEKLKKFSRMYTNEEKLELKNFSIIPCSTLFYESSMAEEEVINRLEEKIKSIEFKQMKVLCINNTILDFILDFLGVNKNERQN